MAEARRLVVVIDHRFVNLDAERAVLAAVNVELRDLRDAPDETVMEAAAEADGILLGARYRFDRDRIRRLQRCRVISRYGIGVDNVDLAAAAERGIAVTFVPDYGIEEVANHALALLLAIHRRLFEYDAAVRAGAIAPARPVAIPRLSQCTLGILGFGRIGREVARRAAAFGLRLLVHDPVVPADAVAGASAQPASLAEVISSCDFLTLHLPLSDATRHLLNAEAIASMRPGAVVINVARGGLVDEAALAAAIRSGHLGGAGLDVTEVEPLPMEHELRDLPGVILTPHSAWISTGARADLRRKAAEEVARVLSGSAPLNAAR